MLGRVGGNSRSVTLEEGVEPGVTYEVKLTADTMNNTSAIFFQIRDRMRAEEITLVLLILLLWVVAIVLFVHRWGKIRMLEPYQPEYKPLNHSPACPLAPTTPTQANPRPPNQRPLLPRKSSSLCFTPSMLRSVQVPPPSCRISVPHIDQTPIHRYTRTSSHSPAHTHGSIHSHHGRPHPRLRLASDSLDQSTSSSKKHSVSEHSRKVRSAENLRNYRVASMNRSYDETCRGSYCGAGPVGGGSEGATAVCHIPLSRRRSCQSQSLDLENYRSTTPLLHEAAPRVRSLDSNSVSSLRRSPTAGPSWATNEGGTTTPELRVSPTPPSEVPPPVTHHSHPHGIVLQRQETIDDALLPVPYATLMEEEMENEV